MTFAIGPAGNPAKSGNRGVADSRIGAGLVQTIPKSSIIKREISKNSGMPVGLEQTMSKQEFVDLVEYLTAQR